MQTVIHLENYAYVHPIFLEFENLYRELSNNDATQRIPLYFDHSMKVFEDIFNDYGNCKKYLNYSDTKYPQLDAMCKGKNIIVGFSGGKDSTATALYFKDKGFNVYLYHVHGFNKFFPQELDSAKEVAEKLGLPLIVENVKLIGKSLYPDHPLKNIIIANMAIQWGIRNGVGIRVAMGDYYTASFADVEFETAGNDCMEMWKAYKSVMKKYMSHVKIEFPLLNADATMQLFVGRKDLLESTQSCVMTYRFKSKHRERIQRDYNVKLMPNRCGCCWKCAVEYVWFCDHNMLEYNKDYYIHCLEVLLNTVEKETGYQIHNVDYIWGTYFFYPMEESIAYKELRNAIVYARKIKVTY